MSNFALNGITGDIKGGMLDGKMLFNNENQWTLLSGNIPTTPKKGTTSFKFWYQIDRDQKRIDYLFWVRFLEDMGSAINGQNFDPVLVDLSSIIDNIKSINGSYTQMLYGSQGMSIEDNLSFSGSKIIENNTTGVYNNEPIMSTPKYGEDTCYLTYS